MTPNKKPNLPILKPELVEKIIENQTREIELRAEELSLHKQQEQHGFEFNKKALEAQLTDRGMQREYNKSLQKGQYLFGGFLVLIISTVIVFALFLDKENIALEIIKAIVFICAGGIGGYGLSRNKEPKQIDKHKEE